MAEIPWLFASMEYRKKLMEKVTNPQTHQFWIQYDKLRPWEKSIYLEGALNRLDQFLASDIIYRIVSQRHTTVPFKRIFQSEYPEFLLVQLPPRNRELANFLGSVFLTILSQTAWEQSLQPKRDRRRIHIYLDEYSRFASSTSSSLLKEHGKLNVCTTIAHQTLSDLRDEENQQAELQAGNLILFQLTGDDAEVMVKNLTVPPEEIKIDPRQFAITREPYKYLVQHGWKNPAVQYFTDHYLRALENYIERGQETPYVHMLSREGRSIGPISYHLLPHARTGFNDLFIACMDNYEYVGSDAYYDKFVEITYLVTTLFGSILSCVENQSLVS